MSFPESPPGATADAPLATLTPGGEGAARGDSPAHTNGPAARMRGAGTPRRYLRNVLAIGVARGSDMFFAFVWLAIVNRKLGAVAMGKYYGIVSLIFLVTIIPEMGMDQA